MFGVLAYMGNQNLQLLETVNDSMYDAEAAFTRLLLLKLRLALFADLAAGDNVDV